jgi:hypothetical protein
MIDVATKIMVLDRPTSKVLDKGRKEIKFPWNAVNVKADFFRYDEAAKTELKKYSQNDGSDSLFDSFVVLTVVTESSKATRVAEKTTTLVLEFDNEQKLNYLLEVASLVGIDHKEMNASDAMSAATLLMENSKENLLKRNKVTPSKEKKRAFRGRKRDEVLLVYPFDATDREFDDAAKALGELEWRRPNDFKESTIAKQRSHYVTIRVEDYQRLAPEQWLNDSLVDFWMLWYVEGNGNCFFSLSP